MPIDRVAKFVRVPSQQLPSVCRSAVAANVEAYLSSHAQELAVEQSLKKTTALFFLRLFYF